MIDGREVAGFQPGLPRQGGWRGPGRRARGRSGRRVGCANGQLDLPRSDLRAGADPQRAGEQPGESGQVERALHRAIGLAQQVGQRLQSALAQVDVPGGREVAHIAIDFGLFDRQLLVLASGLARGLDLFQADDVAAERGRLDAQIAAVDAAVEFHVRGAGPLGFDIRAQRAIEFQPRHAAGGETLEHGQRQRRWFAG